MRVLNLFFFCLLISCQNPAGNPKLAGPVYPLEIRNARSLPIQVIRQYEYIDIINSTAQRFKSPILWINQRYSTKISTINPGEIIRINLWSLRDAYGEQMNAGGIWRTGDPTPVVIAELQLLEDEPLIGLIVIGED